MFKKVRAQISTEMAIAFISIALLAVGSAYMFGKVNRYNTLRLGNYEASRPGAIDGKPLTPLQWIEGQGEGSPGREGGFSDRGLIVLIVEEIERLKELAGDLINVVIPLKLYQLDQKVDPTQRGIPNGETPEEWGYGQDAIHFRNAVAAYNLSGQILLDGNRAQQALALAVSFVEKAINKLQTYAVTGEEEERNQINDFIEHLEVSELEQIRGQQEAFRSFFEGGNVDDGDIGFDLNGRIRQIRTPLKSALDYWGYVFDDDDGGIRPPWEDAPYYESLGTAKERLDELTSQILDGVETRGEGPADQGSGLNPFPFAGPNCTNTGRSVEIVSRYGQLFGAGSGFWEFGGNLLWRIDKPQAVGFRDYIHKDQSPLPSSGLRHSPEWENVPQAEDVKDLLIEAWDHINEPMEEWDDAWPKDSDGNQAYNWYPHESIREVYLRRAASKFWLFIDLVTIDYAYTGSDGVPDSGLGGIAYNPPPSEDD